MKDDTISRQAAVYGKDHVADPNKMVEDLISRQAAIDALDVLCQEHRYKIPGKLETYSQYNEAWQDALDRAEGAIGNLPSAQQWIPCSERLPEEDHWLGGSGRQFSEEVMVTIVNHSDEDTWVDMTQTIDGEWACELPKYCEIVAWMPLPEAWKGDAR